jgi:hypothetical protein
MLAYTVEGVENLDALFEYALPDWAIPEGPETTMNSNRGRSEDVGGRGLILQQYQLAGILMRKCVHVS